MSECTVRDPSGERFREQGTQLITPFAAPLAIALVVSRGDVIEGVGLLRRHLVEQWIEEAEGRSTVGDHKVIQQRDQTRKGRRGAGSAINSNLLARALVSTLRDEDGVVVSIEGHIGVATQLAIEGVGWGKIDTRVQVVLSHKHGKPQEEWV